MNLGQESQFCPVKPPKCALNLAIKCGESEAIFPLGKNFYSIGRDPDRDIRLDSPGISRYHASLIWFDQGYRIVDGDPDGSPSKNGIKVNGKKIKKKALEAGDKITFCRGVNAEIIISSLEDSDSSAAGRPGSKTKAVISKAIELSREVQSNFDLFSSFPDLIIKLDGDGHVLRFQNAADKDLPTLSCQHLEQAISECFPINFSLNLFKSIRQAEKTQTLQILESLLPINGHFLFCEARIFPVANNNQVAIIRNISEQKKREQKLLVEAVHDSLTGLPNRSFFMERAAHCVALKKKKNTYNFAILFIDLDRFKIINDSLGHLAGDRLLIEVSGRLKDCLRPQDIVARLGGDEFAILLHDIQALDEAVEITERLQERLALPLILESREIFPSASIGLAFSKIVYENVEDIIKDADIAMYKSKSAGRSRYTVFEQEPEDRLLGFLQLDSSLKRAIERQEFILHYQPIFELKTRKIIGLEALIRWNHPQKGLLEPKHFLTQAEETGLTDAMGKWTLQEACRQLRQWDNSFAKDLPMFLSINVSRRQFSSLDFVDSIRHSICRYQISTHRLKLEISEATIMADIQASITILNQLTELGIKILIDDFGTGYSSLSYLNDFPIDALKIDRSFVEGMDKDSTSTGFTIIQSIIGLAHNLGVEVIAEGVECTRHVAWLRSFNCDYGQGFYFGEPVEPQAIKPLIKAEIEAWSLSQAN